MNVAVLPKKRGSIPRADIPDDKLRFGSIPEFWSEFYDQVRELHECAAAY
jgi:hypothetical protein